MTTQLKVSRKDFIDKLKAIKEDNIQIADVLINRSKLIEALRLQNQEDVLTLTYGKISWQDDGSKGSNDLEPETCVQFSCNHTVMRFLNRPKVKYGEPKAIPLNFVDHRDLTTTKTELTGIPLDTLELIDALTFVIHGVATETARPVLCCILFDCGNDSINLVTSDGYRLSTSRINAQGIATNKVLIYSSDIPKLATFLKANFPGKGKHKAWLPVYFHATKTAASFMSEKGTMEFDSLTEDYHYPDYPKLIPDNGTHIQVAASEMLEAVKALKHIAKDGSGIIRLKFSKYPSKLTLSARSEELGESSAECAAVVDRECKIGANAKYLVDLLAVCKDNIIDLFVTTPSSPMVICNGTMDQLEVIMPMFVQWGDR